MELSPDYPLGRIGLINRLVADAFQLRRAPKESTSRLVAMQHDRDLVPKVTQKLGELLTLLQRDTNVVYDIQGLHDHGVDTLIRCDAGTNVVEYIGIQIKSHRELLEPKLTLKLIQQHHDAESHYPGLRYYIFLAADLSDRKAHRTVRDISARFATIGRVTVVDPQYVSTFFTLTQEQMSSMVTRIMRPGDPVLLQAADELDSLGSLGSAIVLRAISLLMEGKDLETSLLLDDGWINNVAARAAQTDPYDDWSLSDKGRQAQFFEMLRPSGRQRALSPRAVATAIERLVEQDIFTQGPQDRLMVRLAEVVAILCLMTEGQIRHELDGIELTYYLVSLLERS